MPNRPNLQHVRIQGQGPTIPGQQGPRMMNIQGTRIIQQQVPQQGANAGQTTIVSQVQTPTTGTAALPPPPYPGEPPPPYPGAGNPQSGNQVRIFFFLKN